jgi:hypothetical protein
VEDGSKIRSWYEQCCAGVALKEAFPILFGIARDKNCDSLRVLWWFQPVECKLR